MKFSVTQVFRVFLCVLMGASRAQERAIELVKGVFVALPENLEIQQVSFVLENRSS